MISEHVTEFAGRRVEEYDAGRGIGDPQLAYKLMVGWERHEEGVTFADVLAAFLRDPRAAEVSALVIGEWGGAAQGEGMKAIVKALVAGRQKLPRLRALFLGDVVSEECEISWIKQTDLTPLFPAFPQLEVLRVRGGDGLSLGQLNLPSLRTLGPVRSYEQLQERLAATGLRRVFLKLNHGSAASGVVAYDSRSA